ncbi:MULTISPECIES: flavin reductase family protein [Streptomyces]|uniref:Flavin reductase n=2 Tax=Streptomyces TaxID=1883 RepID=A0A100Y8Q5_9ACTN|nr:MULTISPECIES: flavin reductase family protein [Streptomyces]KUH39736.1 flavin reductase [Streptomyces kanasensis]UUS34562.1 flavin reductase family protein [Streptomyces changanensis]
MTTATRTPSHIAIAPSILYFGTPVALLTTENEDGSANVAPVSSVWALGQTVVLGLGADSRTAANLATRPELVINLPSPDLWGAVERLAPLTGASPVPAAKRARGYRYEPDKFTAAGLTPAPSETVRAPRVAECPLQLEARVRRSSPDSQGHFLIVECAVARVHADRRIVVPGTQHIDPTLWSPLIFNFRHYHGLAPELGHCFTSQTPTGR